ncbi:MAG: MarR family transcriptional regulator [Desulfurococcaceae archaeon]
MGASDLDELAARVISYLTRQDVVAVQSELWKELKFDSKQASRILKRLEEEGYIVREPITYKGRKTFRLVLTEKAKSLLKPSALEKAMEVPCVRCPFIDRCYEGGFYDPLRCRWISEWLFKEGVA